LLKELNNENSKEEYFSERLPQILGCKGLLMTNSLLTNILKKDDRFKKNGDNKYKKNIKKMYINSISNKFNLTNLSYLYQPKTPVIIQQPIKEPKEEYTYDTDDSVKIVNINQNKKDKKKKIKKEYNNKFLWALIFLLIIINLFFIVRITLYSK
jgi:ATP-dependent Zn protease